MKISQVAKEALENGGVVIIWCVDCSQSEKPFICFDITSDISARFGVWIRSFKLKGEVIVKENCDSSTGASAAAKQSFIAPFRWPSCSAFLAADKLRTFLLIAN